MSSEEFKILTPREHVRTRMSIYLGSPEKFTTERFVGGKWRQVNYVPALVKSMSEIVDNSVDEAIRTDFKFATKIDVSIKNNTVIIEDNGRGIPQDIIVDVDGTKIPRPVAAWVRTNSGTNFDDTARSTQGMNGVGSACTNFISSSFVGQTWRDGKRLEVVCSNGAENVEIKESKSRGHGTRVTFTPDFSIFEADNLDEGDNLNLIEDRLINLQVSFPNIDFTFNGQKIPGKKFKDYANQFSEDNVHDVSDAVSYVIFPSDDGFRHNSFINGLNTHEGGTHVDYIMINLVNELSAMIKRKYKVEVANSVIRGGLSLVVFVRGFINPRFSSQTKERFTSTMGQFKTFFEAAGMKDIKLIAKQIMNNPVIIDPIVAAQLAKKLADESRQEALAKKKIKKIKVAKHISATSQDATLFMVEGNSALGFSLAVRDPKKAGFYPMRGVVKNIWGMKPVEVLKNKELAEIIAILGLDISDPDSVDNMTYKNVASLTDADVDGAKISTLLTAFFYKFWPRLFTEGRFGLTQSPVMISIDKKGNETWTYDPSQIEEVKKKLPNHEHVYIKGLGSLTKSQYSKVINDPHIKTVKIDNPDLFEMMFGLDSAPRKEFMMR